MSDASDLRNRVRRDHPKSDKESLERLRQLLLGPEQALLEHLKERLDDPDIHAREISRILPKAIRLRSSKDKVFIEALMPAVQEIMNASAREDREALVGALFPVMGPAIRKYISEKFQEMIQTLSRALENSLSWRGITWRMEALKTGRSFGEVALLHSLVFQVEQIFLIHRQTGLVLQHVVAQSTDVMDADIVSGMLTAIQDFVHDSFGGDEGDSLSTLQYGPRTIWIEQGPNAVLAGVVRGEAPQDLKKTFQDALEAIHLERPRALESFDGNAAAFDDIRPYLEACLEARFQVAKRKTSPFLWIIVALIAGALGLWAFYAVREHLRWTDYLDRLKVEPGIAVTQAEKRGGKYIVRGLRDPLAADPQSILARTELKPHEIVIFFEPYNSLNDAFVLKRVKAFLEPPDSVDITMDDGRLKMTGQSSNQWAETARLKASSIPGVRSYDDSELVGTLSPFRAYVERLEKEPGVVVVTSDSRAGKHYLTGLRDPLAVDPESLLAQTNLNPKDVVSQWKSYHSMKDDFIYKRSVNLLNPPETVLFSVKDGWLKAKGAASEAWVEAARQKALTVPGVVGYDDGELIGEFPPFKAYLELLEKEPGIVIVSTGHINGKYRIKGLKDPLAKDPLILATRTNLDPESVEAHWAPYTSLDDDFVYKRAVHLLAPPDSVEMTVENGRLKVTGQASDEWIETARQKAATVPGAAEYDDSELIGQMPPFRAFIESLESEPGIVVASHSQQNGRYFVRGMRDPLAKDPQVILGRFDLDPENVEAHWKPYTSLDDGFIHQRAGHLLAPPDSVQIAVKDRRLIVTGQASDDWIETARQKAATVPGAAEYDDSELIGQMPPFRAFIESLENEPGIVVASHSQQNGRYFVRGMRDPLAKDPQVILSRFDLDPENVEAHWETYTSLDDAFIYQRAGHLLAPPDSVEMTIENGRLKVTGQASDDWIEAARQKAATVPGVAEYDDSELIGQMPPFRAFIESLESEPGIVVASHSQQNGRYFVRGMRDPLAKDPQVILGRFDLDPENVEAHWEPYTSLDDGFIHQRAGHLLAPPDSVQIVVKDRRLIVTGQASDDWIETARQKAATVPGMAEYDDNELIGQMPPFKVFIESLENEPGIVVASHSQQNGKYFVRGMRDPLAKDPQTILGRFDLDPENVEAHWEPYTSLDDGFVYKRAVHLLAPPDTVEITAKNGRLKATGRASDDWIETARQKAASVPGVAEYDDSELISEMPPFRAFIKSLENEPGIVVASSSQQNGKYYVKGMRDPLAKDPQTILGRFDLDPENVEAHWESYTSLDDIFILKRAVDLLAPPDTVEVSIQGGWLKIIGTASSDWTESVRQKASIIAGVTGLDDSGLTDEMTPFAAYIQRLEKEPGIFVVSAGSRNGKHYLTGMRDSLAENPVTFIKETGLDPKKVVAHWEPYNSLNDDFIYKRAEKILSPPKTVEISVAGGRVKVIGNASSDWAKTARDKVLTIPGAVAYDDSELNGKITSFEAYVERLEREPGIVVVSAGSRNGQHYLTGLRDPLAVAPEAILKHTDLDPGTVIARWKPYTALSDDFILKRTKALLKPPETVEMAVVNGELKITGSSTMEWIDAARQKAPAIPGLAGLDDGGLHLERAPFEVYAENLDREPGIVVISSVSRNGRLHLTGMRDPLAADPAAILVETGLDPDTVVARFEPYQALDEEIVLKRARAVLNPPASVSLTLNRGLLTAKGKAPQPWVISARRLARTIPGVMEYNDGNITAAGLKRFEQVRASLEKKSLEFKIGTAGFVPEAEKVLVESAAEIKALQELARLLDKNLIVEIVGRTDSTGTEVRNMGLSRQRADKIRSFLVSKGISWYNLYANGVGDSEPLSDEKTKQGRAKNRSASFRVIIE